MINIADVIRQLSVNAQAIRAQVQRLSPDQAQWQPNPETWSLQQVIEHVYNEERLDFRKHLKELLNNPPLAWGASAREEYIHISDYHQALQGFLNERETSLAWLKSLESPGWEYLTQISFGPSNKKITLSAGATIFTISPPILPMSFTPWLHEPPCLNKLPNSGQFLLTYNL